MINLLTPLFWMAAALAVIDWYAVWRNWRMVEVVAKTATMLALLGWLAQVGWGHAGLGWYAAALVFSLLGDIALLLSDRWFLAGLVSFFIAHLGYVVAFNQTIPPISVWLFVWVLAVYSAAIVILRPVRAALEADPHHRKMVIPVMLYGSVLALMTYSALITPLRPDWGVAGWLLVVGGLLFMASDSLLAHTRFVRDFAHSRVWVHMTYHTAQILITLAAVWHVVG